MQQQALFTEFSERNASGCHRLCCPQALADRHPEVAFPPDVLTLDYAMFEWLTLHTLRSQLAACVAGLCRLQAQVDPPLVTPTLHLPRKFVKYQQMAKFGWLYFI